MTMTRFILLLSAVAIFACPNSGSAALVGHWTFDDTAANSKPTAGTVNGDGTLHGGVAYDSTESKVGGTSMYFDGVDGYVDIGYIPTDNPLQMAGDGSTFAFWMLDSGSASTSRIFDKATQGFARGGYAIWTNARTPADTAYETLVYRSGNRIVNPDGSLSAGGGAALHESEPGALGEAANTSWHHVVFTRNITDPADSKYYVDGVEVGFQNQSGDPLPQVFESQLKFGIGGDPGGTFGGSTAGQFFSGNLDDMGFWDVSLTAGEAIGIYTLSDSVFDYDQSAAEQLYDLHNAGTGTVQLGDTTWSYATGLSGSNGKWTDAGGMFALMLDAEAGTGVLSNRAIPEPSAVVILTCLGGLALAARRNR